MFFSYKEQLDAYISIHYLRCMSLATNARCGDLDSDWCILKNMGNAVRCFKYCASDARDLLEVIRAAPGAGSVHMDDLACCMCLSH